MWRQALTSIRSKSMNRAFCRGLSSDGAIPSGWNGLKRFYDTVEVVPVTADAVDSGKEDSEVDGYHVMIQGRLLRTNGLNELLVPSYPLALSIAAEFGRQQDKINPASTPLYNHLSRAIDVFGLERRQQAHRRESLRERANDMLRSRASSENGPSFEAVAARGLEASALEISEVLGAWEEVCLPDMDGALTSLSRSETHKLRSQIKDYLETDTACFRVSPSSGSGSDVILRRHQDAAYDPLLDWFAGVFGTRPHVVEGIRTPEHDIVAYEALEWIVDRAHPVALTALSALLGATKSTTVSLAAALGHIDAAQAVAASRVEEEFQIDEYGFVEDGHDIARSELKVRVGAAASLLWLVPQARASLVVPQPLSLATVRAETRLRRFLDLVDDLDRDEKRAKMEQQFLVSPESGTPTADPTLDDDEDDIDPSLDQEQRQLARALRQQYRQLTQNRDALRPNE